MQIDVVVGASKFEQRTSQAPASVTIITAEEIRRYGHRTLAEVLQSVRGFYIRDDRNYTYVGLRGVGRPGDYTTRILVTVDGHRLNSDWFDGVYFGSGAAIDLDVIERIEVIRGPGSCLYGTNALLAVINIVTRSGSDVDGARMAVGAGSHGTWEGRVIGGGGTGGGAGWLAAASILDSRGQRLFFEEFDDPAGNHGVAEDADGDESYRLFASASAGRFRFQAGHASRTKVIPTGSFGTIFNDPRTHTVDSHSFADIQYTRPLRMRGELAARLYHDRTYYHGTYSYDYPPPTLFKDYGRGYMLGTEIRALIRPTERQTLTAGVEHRRHIRLDAIHLDDAPRFVYLDQFERDWDWGVYLEDEIRPWRKVSLSVGLRHDRYRSFGGTTNPRAAIIVAASEATTVKILHGRAFRAPNAYELFYMGGATGHKVNQDLGPEGTTSSEVVLERSGRRTRYSASVFRFHAEEIINLLTDPSDGLLYFDNVDSIESRGAEAEIALLAPSGAEARLAHVWQRSREGPGSRPAFNSPRNLAKLSFWAPLAGGKLGAALQIHHTGARRTLAGRQAPSTWLAHLTLASREIAPGLSLSAGVRNLLDRRYGEPGSEEHVQDVIEQNGRTVRAEVAWRF